MERVRSVGYYRLKRLVELHVDDISDRNARYAQRRSQQQQQNANRPRARRR